MEFVILGLLLLKSMTGYEIGRFIKNNFSMICSNSAGSVQTALKKLVTSNSIDFEEFVENGKNKKVFFITAKGKEEFLNWVQKPMQTEKIKNMELSKLFFLGFATKQQRKDAIADYILQLKTVKDTLLFIKEEFEKAESTALKEVNFENTDEILTFQRYTLDYGIDVADFEISWYTKLLNDMEG